MVTRRRRSLEEYPLMLMILGSASISRDCRRLSCNDSSARRRELGELVKRFRTESVWLSFCLVCLLELAELAPASVLLGLCWVGIFLAFEPKAEPVHVALLRSH